MSMRHDNSISRAGFTLVEVMIAMLIGMVGILVMMQTFSVSEGFKRTATTGTEAQTNGSVALYMLERELRVAGFGVNELVPMGCTSMRVYSAATNTATDVRIVPFEINPAGIPAGDANSDVIAIVYGNADSFVIGVKADQVGGVTTGAFVVQANLQGFHNGDLVVAFNPTGGSGGVPGCQMHEVTAAPGSTSNHCGVPPPQPNQVVHALTSYKKVSAGCATVTPKYNPPAGGPILVTSPTGRVYNLGPGASIKYWVVRGGNLTFCDAIQSDCTVVANYTVAVDNIVSLRAVYGKDFNPVPTKDPGDGIVDTWDRAALVTNFQASRVLAAMIEVTARSPLKEKKNASGVCDITADSTQPDKATDWIGKAYVSIDVQASDTDWGCYRYKMFQTVVPLRNMIWRPSLS